MRRNKVQGITTTELMTVVTIIGILVSIGAVSMKEYIKRTRLKTAIQMVSSDIRRARWIARSTSKTCFIKFDTGANTYTINGTQFTKIPDGLRFGVDLRVTGSPTAPGTPPPADGISFDSPGSANTVIYYPTGNVVPAGTIYLTDGKQTMAVRVARTGRPKIWRSLGGRKWTTM